MSNQHAPSNPQINATVMASAGTGKTYLLVNRLVRLLLAGARPDAILAITFTRKAAAEMQVRLSERLLDLASADDSKLAKLLQELHEPEDPATMAKARQLYESLLQSRQTVRTTTFHAFCQEMLLRFPLEADVPPGFELLESSSEKLQAAYDAMLAEASTQPDGELAAALEYLLDYCGSIDGLQRALDSFISHRGDWWAYTEQTDEPVAYALDNLQSRLDIDPNANPLETFFADPLINELAEFAELLQKHPNKGNNEALDALATARNTELNYSERFEACRQAFLTQKNTPRARKASKAQSKSMGAEGEVRFLEIHDQFSRTILKVHDQQLAVAAWHANRAWYIAGTALLGHFQQLKQEQRNLDFTDLEWRAYRLLNHGDNALWVQYKLDQRIDHLLVDEFQDTNPTQWRLLLPLLQEMAASQSERQRSVFLVGDAKQSIYRFRRAEPRLFQAAHDWMEEQLGAEAHPLHISWRSAPAIMTCVNNVFDENGPLHGQLRNYTRHETHHDDLWGQVTIMPLIADTSPSGDEDSLDVTPALRNPLQQPRTIDSNDSYLCEGQQIATTIKQLVDSGQVIGRGESARKIRYGDVMILLRKRTHSGDYEQALRDAGIPYLGAERGTLLQSLEVRDMVALLEVLITPYNNLSLATILRSPLFDCSDKDLIRIANFDKGGWYQRLQALASSLELQHPIAAAAKLLEQWRQLAGQVPIHDLLDRIFSEGNVLARYQSAFPAHLATRARANLLRFLELALEIDSGRYPSLGHFLARLSEMRDNSDEAPDEASVSESSDRVRILTIHASKGLEAPVVFLADSAQGSSADKAYRTLLHWPPEAARPESFMLIGKKEQHPESVCLQLDSELEEQERESANLLYVALTRARQAIYVSGVKPKRGDNTGWYGVLRRSMDPQAETSPDEACILESGIPESLPHGQPPAEQAEAITVDPHLSKPLNMSINEVEIAPSYQNAAIQSTSYTGDEDGKLRGIVIHRLLQEMTQQDEAHWKEHVIDVLSEFNLNPDSAEALEWYRECRELLQDTRLAEIFEAKDGIEAINEVPLIYRHDNKTVNGIIDRLILRTDEIWIVDYKTHRHANRNNVAELTRHYRQQIDYYATGIKQLWPEKNIRGFLLFTTLRLLHEVPL